MLSSVLFLGLVACAQGDFAPAPDDPPSEEEEQEDTEQPGGAPGSSQCEDGFHACGQTCLADSATNDKPELGCALGCGQPCPTPANGTAICTDDGVCGFTCNSGFARVGNNCVAAVCDSVNYDCGTYTDAAGTRFNCGTCAGSATCGPNHTCVIAADGQEPNNSLQYARPLGDFNDYDNDSQWVEGLNIDKASDQDWFQFHVTDGWDGGNPDIDVKLTRRADQNGWLASPHEITVWFKCDTGDAGTTVSCGEWYTEKSENTLTDPALGKGCKIEATNVVWANISTHCTSIDDEGTVTIKVGKTSPPAGDAYDLYVEVY